jgi:hypothetical protein
MQTSLENVTVNLESIPTAQAASTASFVLFSLNLFNFIQRIFFLRSNTFTKIPFAMRVVAVALILILLLAAIITVGVIFGLKG